MCRAIVVSLAIGLLNVGAWAQQAAGAGAAQAAPDRETWMKRTLDRIADELGLDEQQRAQLHTAYASYHGESGPEGSGQAGAASDGQPADQSRNSRVAGLESSETVDAVLRDIEPILREDQLSKLWEIQDRTERRRSERQRYRTMIRDLPGELNLNPTQKTAYQRILAAQQEQMRARQVGTRPLLQQLREASEAGNTERVAELREQLDNARPDSDELFVGVFDELETMLDNEQLQRLNALRAQFGLSGASDEGAEPLHVRNVLRAAKRAGLSPEQRESLRGIEATAIQRYRKIDRRDDVEQTKLAIAVKSEIAALLDEGQKEKFEQYLGRLERRSRESRTP